jgi:hypothetical protein
MKLAKADIYRQVSSLSALKFEEQPWTSFAGLLVFQKLFEICQLKPRLHEARAHLEPGHITMLCHDPTVPHRPYRPRLPAVT